MRAKVKVLIGTAVAIGVVGSAVGVGIAATSDDGSDAPLKGSALDEATTVALAHVGGGEVIETESGDGGAADGVEIRKDDGSVVDVQVDASFAVTGVETDDDGGAGEHDS